MSATHDCDSSSKPTPVLYCGLELGLKSCKLAFTTGLATQPRLVTIHGRDVHALASQIGRAKQRFSLPAGAQVVSCFEAGRDGFWLHRWLCANGVKNHVIDSASIEVNRRARRAKTDRLDAGKLVNLLIRYDNGETAHWKEVVDPGPEQEDLRQPEREMIALKGERTRHVNQIKAALARLGLDIIVDEDTMVHLDALRQWDGRPVPPETRARVLRDLERWKLVNSQIEQLESRQRRELWKEEVTPQVEKVRLLLDLKGMGLVGSWLLVRELFGWRKIKNRRQLASLVGLAPSPYQSGESFREQGISKAGNKRVRWVMVQLAWMWLRHQPESALSCWYYERFGKGKGRPRKVGIVALARKLLIALWKYVEQGEVPEGARLSSWDQKRCSGEPQPRKERGKGRARPKRGTGSREDQREEGRARRLQRGTGLSAEELARAKSELVRCFTAGRESPQ